MSLVEIDLEAPLLEKRDRIKGGRSKSNNAEEDDRIEANHIDRVKFLSHGAIVRSLVHIVSLVVSYGVLIARDDAQPLGGGEYESAPPTAIRFLSILKGVDFVFEIMVLLVFTWFTLVRPLVFASEDYDAVLVILSLHFLVGFVFVGIVAWCATVVYLGFPIPLKPVICNALINVLLYCVVEWVAVRW